MGNGASIVKNTQETEKPPPYPLSSPPLALVTPPSTSSPPKATTLSSSSPPVSSLSNVNKESFHLSNVNSLPSLQSTLPTFQKEEIDTRKPLTTKEEVLSSTFAVNRIQNIIKKFHLGKRNRWHSILIEINERIQPPEDLISIDMPILFSIISEMISEITSINSSELTLARKIIKELYHSHNIENIEKISQQERERLGIFDPSFFYSEISPEIFATIFLRISTFFNIKKGGILYDLGSGVGQLVYTASIIGNFDLCIGIEVLPSLQKRAKLLSKKLNSLLPVYPNIRNLKYEFKTNDFLNSSYYNDGKFFILNWTCFTNERKVKLQKILSECNEGVLVLSFSYPLESKDFISIYQNECDSSLGKVKFFINEKITSYESNSIKKEDQFNIYTYDQTVFFHDEIEQFNNPNMNEEMTETLKDLNAESVENLW